MARQTLGTKSPHGCRLISKIEWHWLFSIGYFAASGIRIPDEAF
jgi:hypothetical protein